MQGSIMPARLPDFLGIGTQKGGTTSLHQWLQRHHQVYLPNCKELHYFDLNNHRKLDWYKNHFKNVELNKRCGEITPYYLFHPDVPKRISKTLPKVKMIVLLRDPVERTISQIIHAKKRGFEPYDAAKAVACENLRLDSGDPNSWQKHSYVSRSKYIEQLDRYAKYFSKKQLLILKSEQMFSDPERVWEKITTYLEIDSTRIMNTLPKANAKDEKSISIPEMLRIQLRNELRDTALEVRERYGFGWEWA